MINLEQVVFEELSPELREFLRMTMPNLGFFGLLEQMKLKVNTELANLNTDCTDEKFRQKYDKLLLERDLYAQFDTVARRLNEQQTEET